MAGMESSSPSGPKWLRARPGKQIKRNDIATNYPACGPKAKISSIHFIFPVERAGGEETGSRPGGRESFALYN